MRRSRFCATSTSVARCGQPGFSSTTRRTSPCTRGVFLWLWALRFCSKRWKRKQLCEVAAWHCRAVSSDPRGRRAVSSDPRAHAHRTFFRRAPPCDATLIRESIPRFWCVRPKVRICLIRPWGRWQVEESSEFIAASSAVEIRVYLNASRIPPGRVERIEGLMRKQRNKETKLKD